MGEARRRKSDFDRERADAAFKGLLRAADRLA
jgi:hypothetical protein